MFLCARPRGKSGVHKILCGLGQLYSAYLTASYRYIGRYLALENFSCVPNKSMALTPFAIGIAILVSKMKFSSVITPNAYNGFVQDFLGHFPLQISKMPRSIRTQSALKYTASMTIVFEKTPMKVSSTKLG